jgi:hypothetical protein
MGCDSSELLYERFLRKINLEDPDVDVVLISGDMISHDVTLKPG